MVNKDLKGTTIRGIPDSVGKMAVDLYGTVEGTDIVREYKYHKPFQDIIDDLEPNMDTFLGYVVCHTQEGPLQGLRVVDGVQTMTNDLVLVTGLGAQNGVYAVTTGAWVRYKEVLPYQLISINRGLVYAGTIVKKLPNGTSEIVKLADSPLWSVIL